MPRCRGAGRSELGEQRLELAFDGPELDPGRFSRREPAEGQQDQERLVRRASPSLLEDSDAVESTKDVVPVQEPNPWFEVERRSQGRHGGASGIVALKPTTLQMAKVIET